MLLATSEARIGDGAMRSTLMLERTVRGTVVIRDKLAFDTKYAAAAAGRVEQVGHLFLLLEGRYAPSAAEPARGPVALLLADDEIERVGAKSRTFRTDGARVEVVQLRFARADLRVPIGIAHAPLPLPAYVWAAVREVAIDPARLGELIRALARANIIAPTIDVLPEEPERFRRMWQALHPLYTSYGGTASLKQLANSLNMSMRQVGRDAKEMAATFGFGSGYRDTLLVLRLRVAALLLSAPAASVADVASVVGYGSAIAMARAFRDAKLPPPSAVQAAVRGE
jgi:AraC-like DNA-binding protein